MDIHAPLISKGMNLVHIRRERETQWFFLFLKWDDRILLAHPPLVLLSSFPSFYAGYFISFTPIVCFAKKIPQLTPEVL
jgi:hypothetical protein